MLEPQNNNNNKNNKNNNKKQYATIILVEIISINIHMLQVLIYLTIFYTYTVSVHTFLNFAIFHKEWSACANRGELVTIETFILNVFTIGSCSSTSCDADRSDACDNSLCAGCMDPGFVETGSTSDSTDCDGSVNSTSIYTGDDDTTAVPTNTGIDVTDGSDTGSSSGACSIGKQCKIVFFVVGLILTVCIWRY